MNAYDRMIKEQAEKYNTTVEKMDIANRAFAGSDDYKCILLDVYASHFFGSSVSKDGYLKFAAMIEDADFEKIMDGTHRLVQ